jgi:hypothetical protein
MKANKLTDEEKKERKRLYDKVRYEKNKEKLLEQNKQSRGKNKERNAEFNRKYHEENKEVIKERKRLWHLENKEKIKAKNKIWREQNKERILEYNRNYYNEKMKTDELYRLKQIIRASIRHAIKRKNFTKKSKTIEILGCDWNQFKRHIESNFKSWMRWDNYGLYNGTPDYGWDIDHIIPNSSGLTYDDVIKLNHYTNLQPLCSFINRDVKIAVI